MYQSTSDNIIKERIFHDVTCINYNVLVLL